MCPRAFVRISFEGLSAAGHIKHDARQLAAAAATRRPRAFERAATDGIGMSAAQKITKNKKKQYLPPHRTKRNFQRFYSRFLVAVALRGYFFIFFPDKPLRRVNPTTRRRIASRLIGHAKVLARPPPAAVRPSVRPRISPKQNEKTAV